jgi:hypothetical protein
LTDPTLVFVRDDDVADLTPALARFSELLAIRGVPVNYQVIPARLTPTAAAHLVALAERAPGLVEINQHGLEHEQVVGGERRWTEFAGGRPYDEQLAAIRAGQRLMTEAFGPAFDPTVFTPPNHRYDRATLAALAASGVQVLSAGVHHDPATRAVYTAGRRFGRVTVRGRPVSYHLRSTPQAGLVELSTAVNVDMDRAGARVTRTAADVLDQVEQARRWTPVVGLMFHHETYESEAKFGALAGIVDGLVSDPTIELVTMSGAVARCFPRQGTRIGP